MKTSPISYNASDRPVHPAHVARLAGFDPATLADALESGLRALCSRVVYLAAPPGYPRAGALPLVGGAL
jgi:hypothetical protein